MLLNLLIACVCVQIAAGQGVIPGVKNTCFLDPEPGICKSYLPSFYYNKAAKYCDCFVYTGCNGNENRFASLDECRYACNVVSNQQIITNQCRNLFRGTSVLKELLNRPEFQGIENKTKDVSPEVSKGQVPSGTDVDCFQEPVMGPCRAYLPSYFYDTKKNNCDCFVYSGCGGNENRFRTLNDCRLSCDVGPSNQIITDKCKTILQGTSQWDEFLNQLSITPNKYSDNKDTSKVDTSIGINKDSSFKPSTSDIDKYSSPQTSQVDSTKLSPQAPLVSNLPPQTDVNRYPPPQSSQADAGKYSPEDHQGANLPSQTIFNRDPPRQSSHDKIPYSPPLLVSVTLLPARPIPYYPPPPSSVLRDVFLHTKQKFTEHDD